MNRWRVGEDRGSKETDGCPLTDTGDAKSTSNIHKHAKKCWSADVVAAADKANNANEMQLMIVKGLLDPQSITAAFEWKGKGKVTFSHRQHTKTESRALLCIHCLGLDSPESSCSCGKLLSQSSIRPHSSCPYGSEHSAYLNYQNARCLKMSQQGGIPHMTCWTLLYTIDLPSMTLLGTKQRTSISISWTMMSG
jgi:hypothetical protein